MNEKALRDLTYGLFLIGTEYGGKENACIVNTVIQAASSPTRIIFAGINGNLTGELIRKSGFFTVTVLDESAEYPLFENFGMRHGRDTDKMKGYEVFHDVNGMPYLKEGASALFSCRLLKAEDLGSHTLYLAEVVDMEKLSDRRPVTYAEYHSRIKPQKKVEKERKIVGWRCTICGYVYEGETIPDDYLCPLCKHPVSDFEPVYE